MEINYNDPLSGLSSCTNDQERNKLFDTCFGRLGSRGAVYSYMDYDLYKNPDGSFKTISEMTKDFGGLVPFSTFINVLRTVYRPIFLEIKAVGGHLRG